MESCTQFFDDLIDEYGEIQWTYGLYAMTLSWPQFSLVHDAVLVYLGGGAVCTMMSAVLVHLGGGAVCTMTSAVLVYPGGREARRQGASTFPRLSFPRAECACRYGHRRRRCVEWGAKEQARHCSASSIFCVTVIFGHFASGKHFYTSGATAEATGERTSTEGERSDSVPENAET